MPSSLAGKRERYAFATSRTATPIGGASTSSGSTATSRAAAFPVFEASVSYARDGYAAIFGWIQIVRYWSSVAEAPASDLVDVAPQLRGLGVPFLAFGVRPTCFDAPLDTPEGISRWEALTFLTQTPDGLMTRRVEVILGFRWGYEIERDSPTPIPPVLAEPQDWRYAKARLEAEFPTWAFDPKPADSALGQL